MFVKVGPVAVTAALLMASVAMAQSVAEIGGPAELPPTGFSQQQYVDSRGCVFLRAGLGGQVRWVPRVGNDRKVLCGYPPTFGAQSREAVAALEQPAPEPAPQPVAEAAPVRQAAQPVAEAPAPRVTPPRPAASARVPVESYVPAPVANLPVRAPDAPLFGQAPVVLQDAPQAAAGIGTGRRIACTTSAPVAERVALNNGGSVIVCTRGDGTLDGWRAPVYPDGAPVGASITPPVAAQERRVVDSVPLGQPSGIGSRDVAGGVAVSRTIPVPEGYQLAWKDDRLNPLRGIGTAEGQAAQDQVWTRKVPAQLVAEEKSGGWLANLFGTKRRAEPLSAGGLTVSTKGQPQDSVPQVASGLKYIQVGAFGDPANAQGATARLQAAGLPVAISRSRGLQVVLAGPFGSASDAQRALSAARGAGFGDAFVR